MPHGPDNLLTDLLRDVSRSFYLTLRVLPRGIRPQIGLAYLLARATDTIADTQAVPIGGRLAALDQLRRRILGQSAAALNFTAFVSDRTGTGAADSPTAAETVLLARIEDALAVLDRFDPNDRQRIRDVLTTITAGQELDLRCFEGGSATNIIGLQTDADLDDYTYRVAGCVGEFWTHMCRTHLFPRVTIDDAQLLSDGVRFGKGLQLVNILRDLPRDLRNGRCYLPLEQLRTAGLAPADLLQPEAISRVQPIYNLWIERAEAHLAAGWSYTNALPYGQFRVRQACAWPLLIGARTLKLLREGNPLDPAHRIKTTRREVRALMVRSLCTSPFPAWWRGEFARARR